MKHSFGIFLLCFLSCNLNAQTSNELYTWGYNATGQLGVGNKNNKNTPQLIPGNFKFVSGGYDFSLAINQKGQLFSCGANGHGQCGDSDYRDHLVLNQIGKDSNWKFVTTGWNHALGINSNGELFGWGTNMDFELATGNDTIYNVFIPRKIGTDTNWVSASAGNYFSLAINSKGELYSWGGNGDGKLGLGNTIQQTTPQRVGKESNWKKIVTGRDFTIAINSKGYLYGFGNNRYGQLGLGNLNRQYEPQRIGNDSDFVEIAAGWYHVLAVKSNGELYSWGRNNSGQLGIGNKIDQTTPVRVGTNSNWVAVATGSVSSLALNSEGKIFSFGDNSLGQMGVGLTKDQTIPNQIGTDSNWTFIASGTAHCLALSIPNGQSAGNNQVKSSKNEATLMAYPNPVKDQLYLNSNGQANHSKFSIMNFTGHLVADGYTDLNQPINVSQIKSGIYILKIGNESVEFIKD